MFSMDTSLQILGKRKKEPITIELKKEIINKYDNGVRVIDLSKMYQRSRSTICTILKNKDEIKKSDAAKGCTIITKLRPKVIDDVEKLLLIWINETQSLNINMTEAIIREKARSLHADLMEKMPSTSSEEGMDFKASRGWYENFMKRSGLCGDIRPSEAAISNQKVTDEEFISDFRALIENEEYSPQQVFTCVKTSLFWKKMPKRTYLMIEEKGTPGHKPMNDKITVLLSSNASGDFKVKPLVVYHSEYPRAFKQRRIKKSQLKVMWRSNSKEIVTPQFFIEWVFEVFSPLVKEFLLQRNLPLKALLVLDNSFVLHRELENELLQKSQFIKIMFLPPNTTPLLQPMDKNVIINFKKLFLRGLFQQCFEETNGINMPLKEYWKKQYNILNCLDLIIKAWSEVSSETLISAWRKLWPDSIPYPDIQNSDVHNEEPVVEQIISIGKNLNLEVNDLDVEELVAEEPIKELSTDELMDIQDEKRQEIVEHFSDKKTVEQLQREVLGHLSEREAVDGNPSSSEIEEICKMWDTVQNFVELHHPDPAVSEWCINLFNDNVILHFKNMLRQRQNQVPR